MYSMSRQQPAFFTLKRAVMEQNVQGGKPRSFTKDGDVYFIRAGGEADRKLLHNDGAASDIRIDRLPMMPKVCNPRTNDTPASNFEVFTRTFAEHYISFD